MLKHLIGYVRQPKTSRSQKLKGPLILFWHNKKSRDRENCSPKFVFLLKVAYWISSNCEFSQYCDSNIGLFSIVPRLVIALPTLR